MRKEALEKITAFIAGHHVLTLATAAENVPHCAPLFYAYDRERNCFVFASDETTEHARQMSAQPHVGAAIHLETSVIGKVQGLQISGRVFRGDKADARCYYSAFPYARAMSPTLWRLEPQRMKLTDNRLGFGKKLVWER